MESNYTTKVKAIYKIIEMINECIEEEQNYFHVIAYRKLKNKLERKLIDLEPDSGESVDNNYIL